MIKGIGVDIVGIESFRKIKSDQDFIEQILTPKEISTLHGDARNAVQIATAFALKEAVMKALGWGLTYGSFWHDIKVTENGQINLTGNLREQATKIRVSKIHSSYSHSKKFITAFVILED